MLAEREKEILDTLKKLTVFRFVLIGGYAVNTYVQPRFSLDCDIVVLHKEDAQKIKQTLEQEGYKEKAINPNIPYAGDFLCLEKEIGSVMVPFDIMIGSVIDRNTKQRFYADWIFEHAQKRKLTGKMTRIELDVTVANPESLILMKLAAARKSDFRDIFMLSEKDIDTDFVLKHVHEYNLQHKVAAFISSVTDSSFRNNLQGVFGKVDDKQFNKIIEKIKKTYNEH